MLILDVKTRWNSLLHMLQRFFELSSCVQKVLIDFKVRELELEDAELEIIKNIVDVLKPMEIIVLEICKRDATILTAAEAFDFAIEEIGILKFYGNSIADQLIECIRKRVAQRERTDLLLTLRYLTKKSDLNAIQYNLVKCTIFSLCDRLQLVEKSVQTGM